MNKVTLKLLSVSTLVLAFPTYGLAMPSVSGNVLTWPDDGWYQVQRTDTFDTVCEGMVSANAGASNGPCIIDGNNHVVINHSSGERFENIRAASASTPLASVSSVTVEGGRISWPNDGWYQVQNADTFETVCEGGQACNVPEGNYLLINHSTGERFNDVRVGSSTPPSSDGPLSVTVDGQMLSWPANGWYQVQDASDFSTVCEGGTGCTVEPGNYTVINHSTGERFDAVVVGGADTPSVDTPSAIVLDGMTIRWPNDGWYQVQNADSFETVCEGGTECLVSPGRYQVINHTNGTRLPLTVTGSDSVMTTQVDFAITVPVYVSNFLQVKLTWGETEFSANWEVDERWRAAAELPRDTEKLLTVSFLDRNGEIVLGSYETSYRTGSNALDFFRVSADNFNTMRWDSDGDGVSNLDESIAGTDPLAVTDPLTEIMTRVNFGINVPVFVSNELQVKVFFGSEELIATWAGDESWSAFGDFPTNTTEPLSVFFYDRNGAIVLGNYQTSYQTGTNDSEYLQIESRQINTTRWDDDSDGVSNLRELSAGTNPLWADSSLELTFEAVKNRLTGSCGGCHSAYRNGITHENLLALTTFREGLDMIIPFDPENSYLLRKVEGDEGISGRKMGYAGDSFSSLLRVWIAAGALDN